MCNGQGQVPNTINLSDLVRESCFEWMVIPDRDQSKSGVDIAIAAHHLQPIPTLLEEEVLLSVLKLRLDLRCHGLHGSWGRGWTEGLSEPVISQTPESLGDSLNIVKDWVTSRAVTMESTWLMAGDSWSKTWSTIWSLLRLKVGLEGWGPKGWAWARFRHTKVGRTTWGTTWSQNNFNEVTCLWDTWLVVPFDSPCRKFSVIQWTWFDVEKWRAWPYTFFSGEIGQGSSSSEFFISTAVTFLSGQV